MGAATTGTVWATAGVVIAATGIVGTIAFTTLSNQWSTANTLGQHTSSLSTLLDEVKTLKSQGLEISSKIEETRRLVKASNMNPASLMTRAGIPLDKGIELVSVGEQVVILPQTQEALKALLDRKLRQVQLTPSIDGFALDDASASIVRSVIDDAVASQADGREGFGASTAN